MPYEDGCRARAAGGACKCGTQRDEERPAPRTHLEVHAKLVHHGAHAALVLAHDLSSTRQHSRRRGVPARAAEAALAAACPPRPPPTHPRTPRPAHLAVNLVQRLQHKLHKGALRAARRRAALEATRVGVKIGVAPEAARKLPGVHGHLVHLGHSQCELTRSGTREPRPHNGTYLGVEFGKGLEREAPAIERRSKCHVALDGVQLRARSRTGVWPPVQSSCHIPPRDHTHPVCLVLAIVSSHQRVNLLDRVPQFVIGVGGRQLELDLRSAAAD